MIDFYYANTAALADVTNQKKNDDHRNTCRKVPVDVAHPAAHGADREERYSDVRQLRGSDSGGEEEEAEEGEGGSGRGFVARRECGEQRQGGRECGSRGSVEGGGGDGGIHLQDEAQEFVQGCAALGLGGGEQKGSGERGRGRE